MMDGGSSWVDQSTRRKNTIRRQRLGLKFPATKQQLLDLLQVSKTPITKLPPGVSRDWLPSWLRPSHKNFYEKVTDEVQTPEPRIRADYL